MGTQPSPRLEFLLVEFKLNGLAMYLSWSRRVTGALARRGVDGYLTREEKELRAPRSCTQKNERKRKGEEAPICEHPSPRYSPRERCHLH